MSDFKTKKPLYKPVKSDKKGKKGMVYVKGANGGKRLIHFGDSSMKDFTQHKDKARQCPKNDFFFKLFFIIFFLLGVWVFFYPYSFPKTLE